MNYIHLCFSFAPYWIAEFSRCGCDVIETISRWSLVVYRADLWAAVGTDRIAYQLLENKSLQVYRHNPGEAGSRVFLQPIILNKIYQCFYILYWGFRNNAMAKIENVTRTAIDLIEQFFRLSLYRRFVRA